MIDLPADIEERAAYPLVDRADRWIFNKLRLAERLGYSCGPSGVDAPAGTYCLRPVMNLAGNSMGGTLKVIADGTPESLPYLPGYFWVTWFNGEHRWTDYTDDVPVYECYGTVSGRRLDYDYRTTGFGAPALPPFLQGLSKHLVVESIGNKIIEVAPRHMTHVAPIGTTYMQKVRPTLPWGFDDDIEFRAFYWRITPK